MDALLPWFDLFLQALVQGLGWGVGLMLILGGLVAFDRVREARRLARRRRKLAEAPR